MEILSLAYSLSLLTFSLGAVLYGSPVPVKSVKKWGVLMMYDGLASALLVSMYSLLVRLSDYLLTVLGVSWPQFMVWLTGRTSLLIAFYIGLQSTATALKFSGVDVLVELLKHVGGLVAASLTAIKMVYLIATVVYNIRDKILAAGILLYALPMRVGKAAGAAMIALSIVYYVGLPLMPAFAAIFESPSMAMPSDNYGSIEGVVIDITGKPIPHPIVMLYTDGSEPVTVVVGDEDGRFYVGPPQDLIRLGKEFNVDVVFMGYKLSPDQKILTVPWSGTLRISNVVYLGNGLSMILAGIVVLDTVEYPSPTSAIIKLSVIDSEASLGFLRLASTNVSQLLVNGEELECAWASFSWRGMVVNECYVQLNPGTYVVAVSYSGVEYPKPETEEKHYVDYGDVVEYLSSLQTTAASYLYSYLLLPSAYLVLLSASSYALSKFLGGGLRLKFL